MSDDQTLLLRYASSRDAEAFAQLVKRYSALVFSVASRVTGNCATAEDVTQDCFFALARQAASIHDSLPGWLHHVALNRSRQVIRDEARRQRRENRISLPSEEDYKSNWNQIAPIIDAALAKLPDELRDPLVQHFLLGQTQTQVAENLNIGQATVSRRLQEGVERLRDHLKQTGVVCGTVALSTVLVKNASAAVPAKLAASLAKMALAGPATLAATASTAAIPSSGGLNLTLIKGALKLMAWTKAKTAIVVCVGVLIAAGTVTVAVKVIEANKTNVWQENWDLMVLDRVPPQVKILPALSRPGRTEGMGERNGALGLGVSATAIVQEAYGVSLGRLIFSAPVPPGKYDFIFNLPPSQRGALQEEIRNIFGVVGRRESIETNVLVMTLRRRQAAGLKPSSALANQFFSDRDNRSGSYSCRQLPLANLVGFLEDYLQIPVVDKTGLTGRFDIDIKGDSTKDGLKRIVQNELGLELVPGREKIEMLVVEKVN